MNKVISTLVGIVCYGWAALAVAVPINSSDIITVDGTEWAQPDLFAGLDWDDVNAVCPAGECLDGGMLNGLTMSSWRWASIDSLNALFNFYIGSPELGPGPDNYTEQPGVFTALFFADGWRPTQNILGPSSDELFGLISDSSGLIASVIRCCDDGIGAANTDGDINTVNVIAPYGAWFYRSGGAVDVPAPPILGLIGLGLAGIGWARSRNSRMTNRESEGRLSAGRD